jgi:hypothetical protein
MLLAIPVLCGAVLAAAPANPIRNPTNITIFHINPQSYGTLPFNMDAGDAAGDLYFLMRSVVSPIECAQDPTAEDCTDAEVVSASLVATKLLMTVDSDYGPYGHCEYHCF